uniref:RIP metalloprotease RseP n=1 Tax=Thermosporothrix sp. COM3 TaxID=2490863 RepID=A0A455SLY0_9CHLR|nr:RIP metalloprotease RseP [Thermosporothrix sp. COM3]
MNWYLLAAIPVLCVLVLVHELGHFLAARWAGIRVEEFGLGFPPRLIGFRRNARGRWKIVWFGALRYAESEETSPLASGEQSAAAHHHTLYSLNLLPIGGFVRMLGEDGSMYDEQGNYDANSFAAKPAFKRIVVLVAGVLMNVLLALVLFTIAYGQGEPLPTTQSPAVIGQVAAGSPAEAAGVHPEDKVLSVNGQKITTYAELKDIVDKAAAAAKGKETLPVQLQIERPGSPQPISITIQARVNPPENQGRLGVVAKTAYATVPLWEAPIKGFVATFNTTGLFISTLGKMVIGAIKPDLMGPVGIVHFTGQVAETVPVVGWWYILNLTAMLSLNLAIVNILPFPALDGGRVLLVLIEIVRGGKRLKPEREMLINLIGMAILLALMAVVTVSDILRLSH